MRGSFCYIASYFSRFLIALGRQKRASLYIVLASNSCSSGRGLFVVLAIGYQDAHMLWFPSIPTPERSAGAQRLLMSTAEVIV